MIRLPIVDVELARRAREIFRAVLEREPGEREAVLEQACAGNELLRQEVASLLEYDRRASGAFSRVSVVREIVAAGSSAESPRRNGGGVLPGSRIGPWRVLDRLGQGGMGSVHRVERADGAYEQQAALKLIRPDAWCDDMARRLESERQVLANLHHPNIARLLDGGYAADGRPYLVMELVDGRPIDRYCDEERLSIDQRLELFAQVCTAVQHAHRALVVHRDLKPSNVVVDAEGKVTLLDFGIARALTPAGAPADPVTRTVARVMTPDYASPEQVLGRAVTTATDVYQLGLLLFELLTGHRAQCIEDLSPGAFERVVCETPIARPSAVVASSDHEPSHARRPASRTLARRLRGDLDSIVAMALRKEPERRYGSAAQLYEDVERHRRGLPVLARPDRLGYRLRRFLGRHRQALAWGALCLTLVVWGIVGSARERLQAHREAERVRQIEAVIGSLFEYPRVTDPGRPPQMSDFVDHAAALVRRNLRDQPASQARLLTRLGRTYSTLGAFQEAVETFEEALARVGPVGDLQERSQLLYLIGRNQHFVGRLTAAEANFREVALLRGKIFGEQDPRTLTVKIELADLLHSLGRLRAAETVIESAVEVLQRSFGGSEREDPEGAEETRRILELQALAHGYLGNVLRDRGVCDRAEEAYRTAIVGLLEIHGPHHNLTVINRIDLARLQAIQGRLDEAEKELDDQVSTLQEMHFGGHPMTAIALRELGFVAMERGRFELAQRHLASSMEISNEWLDADHPTIPRVSALQAELERRRGRSAKAIEESRSALDHFARLGLRGHPSAIDACTTLGLAVREVGEPVEPWVHSHLADCLSAAERELATGDLRTQRLRVLALSGELPLRAGDIRFRNTVNSLRFDLTQPAGFHLVDEAADLVFLRDEGARLDPGHRLADILVEVREGLESEGRPQADIAADLCFDVVVLERQHAAVGVVDQHDLLGAEEALGNGERADHVVADHASGVADDVGLPEAETENPVDVEPSVHAGDDGDPLRRRHREVALVESFGISSVLVQELVGGTHVGPSQSTRADDSASEHALCHALGPAAGPRPGRFVARNEEPSAFLSQLASRDEVK